MSELSATLPDGLDRLIGNGETEEVKALIARCEVGARTESYSETALHLSSLSLHPELFHWLIERGEDVNAADVYGNRPLHHQAGDEDLVRLLLQHGAEADVPNNKGITPIFIAAERHRIDVIDLLVAAGADPARRVADVGGEHGTISYALRRAETFLLPSMLTTVERLADLGAEPTDRAAPFLTAMGQEHERSLGRMRREGGGLESSSERTAALHRLYELCGVDPVPAVVVHDGHSPIEVPEGAADEAFSALWNTLVPDSGQAETAQGEAIRIAGRVGREILVNGGINWDSAYDELVTGLLSLTRSGRALDLLLWDDLRQGLEALSAGAVDQSAVDRVTEIVVEWVRLNPQPWPNPLPDVGR